MNFDCVLELEYNKKEEILGFNKIEHQLDIYPQHNTIFLLQGGRSGEGVLWIPPNIQEIFTSFFQFISVDKNFLDIESSTVGQLNFVLYFLNWGCLLRDIQPYYEYYSLRIANKDKAVSGTNQWLRFKINKLYTPIIFNN